MTDPAEAEWARHRPWVLAVAAAMSKGGGIDADDMDGEAGLALMLAARSHDPSKGGMAKRVKFHVRMAIRMMIRAEERRTRGVTRVAMPQIEARSASRCGLDEMLAGLSQDAARAAAEAINRGPMPGGHWAMRKLMRGWGWDTRRIHRTFAEIQQALRGI